MFLMGRDDQHHVATCLIAKDFFKELPMTVRLAEAL